MSRQLNDAFLAAANVEAATPITNSFFKQTGPDLFPFPYYFKLLSGKIERGTAHSAAFDLFAACDIAIGDRPIAIPTGVRTEFSPNLVAIIKEKSGLALKGLEVKGGVIDSDYRDEWKVIARYPRKFPFAAEDDITFEIKAGQKIAQFILISLPPVKYDGDGIYTVDAMRAGGFGSTGQ